MATQISKAEAKYQQAQVAYAAFLAKHGNCGSPLEQDSLYRQVKRARRAVERARGN
jgi:hypothetical protein